MSKSAIYTVNNTAQTTTAASTILNPGSIVRRFGCNLNLINNSVTATGSGYYDIDANVTFSTSTAGDATFTLYQNNVAIPGATATVTTGATAADYSVNIPAIVRNTSCVPSTISLGVNNLVGSVLNVAITASKL